MSPNPRQVEQNGKDMPLIIAALLLLALACSLPGRLGHMPGKWLGLIAAILLAIACPLFGGPLLLYLIFKR